MKNNEEIRNLPGLQTIISEPDFGMGYIYLDPKKPNKAAAVIWSNGDGWDHVSVSWSDHCPTWEEMCRVKEMFFLPEEAAIEYHPAKSEYVNLHPYCLHLWRPKNGEIIMQPFGRNMKK